MKYHFKLHKEGRGFWAQCIELEGCITQADSRKELDKRMQEALNLYIDEPTTSKDLAALPDDSISLSRSIVEVQVDPSIAFAFMVRWHRIKQGLTQQEVANQLGFEHINSYQRLESRKCNPTLRILLLLKKAFPDFSLDLALGF